MFQEVLHSFLFFLTDPSVPYVSWKFTCNLQSFWQTKLLEAVKTKSKRKLILNIISIIELSAELKK